MSTQLSQLLASVLQTPGDESSLTALEEWATGCSSDGDHAADAERLRAAAGDLGKAGRHVEAVRLLEAALCLVTGPSEVELLLLVGGIQEGTLYELRKAAATYRRVLERVPEHPEATEAVGRLEQLGKEWKRIVERFEEEASAESEPALKSQLYLRIAGVVESFGGKAKDRTPQVIGHLQNALRANPSNHAAVQLLIRVMERAKRLEDLAPQLVQLLSEAKVRDEKVALLGEAAKVYVRLEQPEKAARLYQEVLDFVPGHASALSFLVDYYTTLGESDHLVALYEDALRARPRGESEIELLFQIGMVHWRMRNDVQAAEEFFRRIRKVRPAHPAALNFYRTFCRDTGDFNRLLQILLEAQRAAETDDERIRFLQEIARVAEEELRNDERAIEAYKGILKIRSDAEDVAEQLKRLYAKTEKWNALIDVFKGELAARAEDDVAGRIAVLERMVTVYRDHLKSEMMVIKTYLQILDLDAGHEGAFLALREVFTDAGRWHDLVALLGRRADTVKDVPTRVALYREQAVLWTQRLNNLNNAVKPLEAIREIDPHDAETNAQLKEIYTRRRAFVELYDLLKAELETVPERARVEHMVELAQIAGERLDRRDEAIALWWRIHELEPGRVEAFDTIERLAERAKNFEEVAKVLERRVEQESDENAKVALLTKLAGLWQDRIKDPARASRAYERVLEIQPKNPKAIRMLKETHLAAGDYAALERLYAAQGDWEGLVEALGIAADRVEDAASRIELSFKAAAVYEERIGQPQRAFRAYERVLEADPGNRRAAEALAVIYEGQEDWKSLVRALGVLHGLAADDGGRFDIARRLMDLLSDRINDRAGAFAWARTAYALRPRDGDVIAALELYAEDLRAFEDLLRVYRERLPQSEGEERVELLTRIAEIHASRLGDVDAAVEAYRAVLKESPAALDAVRSLESLLQQAAKLELLADFYRERIEAAENDVDLRLAWLVKLAILLDEGLDRQDEAIATFRGVLDINPDHPGALDALERIYAAGGRHEDLSRVLLRKREAAAGEARAGITLQLGQLYAGPLDRPDEAVEAFREVLTASPGQPDAMTALERYLADERRRLEVARFLQPQFERVGHPAKLAWSLQILVEGTAAGPDRLDLLTRLARVYDEDLGDRQAAFRTISEAVGEYPEDESLWAELDRLAAAVDRRADQADRLEKVYDSDRLGSDALLRLARQLARLCDVGLGDLRRAERYHRHILQHDPDDAASFNALDALLKSEERYEDLAVLLRRRADHVSDESLRVDMLQQLAFLLEDMLERGDESIVVYREILEIRPDHEMAVRALERLYEQRERWEDLAALLDRTVDLVTHEDRLDRRIRIAQLRELRLGEAATAIDDYRAILADRPDDPRLVEAFERLLGNDGLRQQAADLLAPVHERRGEYAKLVRVLLVKLEAAATEADKVIIWTRVAQIREDALGDLDGAFEAWSQAVEADPADPEPRRQLSRIADAQGLHALQADVLEQIVGRVSDNLSLKAEILSRLAALYDQALADPEKAESAYRRWLDTDRDDPGVAVPAAAALERIYAAGERYQPLVDVLEIQARFAERADRRVDLLKRVAEIQETFLGNAEAALRTVEEIDRVVPEDVPNLMALERLYQQAARWADLVEAVRRRVHLAPDAGEKRSLEYRIAETLEEKLGDREEAIIVYQGILVDAPREIAAARALARLFEAAEQWADLLDTERRLLDLAASDAERVEGRVRMGRVQAERTRDLPDAVESYRQALELDPMCAPARAALEKLAAEPDVKLEAARILGGVYEREGRYDRLLEMLDIQIAEAEDDEVRRSTLVRAAEVSEIGLSDVRRAFRYQGQAFRLTAATPDAAASVAELERLAGQTGDADGLAALYREVTPDVVDVALQTGLFLRVAAIAQAGRDWATAVDYYTKVLDNDAENRQALDALEAVYAATERWSDLLEIYRRKADLASAPHDKVALLLLQGALCELRLEDRSSAVSCYEAVLEADDANAEAIGALERLYAGAERWSPLVELIERRIGRPGTDALALHHRAAEIALDRLGDPPRAFDHFRAALEADAAYAPTLERLRELLREGDHRLAAAEVLEDVYRRQMELEKLIEVLLVRHELSEDPAERKDILRRVGQLYEEQLENLDQAFVVYGRRFVEDIEDPESQELVERLAAVMGAWPRLVDLYERFLAGVDLDTEATAKLALRLGEIAEQKLADLGRARAAYRRAHAYDPANADAMASLERVFAATEDWPALLDLLRQVADGTYEPNAKREVLFRIAEILEQRLEDRGKAVETYVEILDVDPADARAVASLDRLYYYEKRWQDLADLLVRQIDQSPEPRTANALRYRLGVLCQEQLADVDRAVSTFEEILRIDVSFREAISAMEGLLNDPDHRIRIAQSLVPVYQQTGDWESLIQVFQVELEGLDDPTERILRWLEIARLYEERGGDGPSAFRAYGAAFSEDPSDAGVLEQLQRLAGALDSWAELVAVVEAGLAKTDDGTLKADLLRLQARTLDRRLGDFRGAVAAYERLIKLEPADFEAIEGLDALLTLLGEWNRLIEILDVKSDVVGDPEQQKTVRKRQGSICEEQLGRLDDAIGFYRKALELGESDLDLYASLADLLQRRERFEELVELYERKLTVLADPAVRRQTLAETARVRRDRLGDRSAAITAWRNLLEEFPGDREALDALGTLLEQEEAWYDLADVLQRKLEVVEAPAERLALLLRLGTVARDRTEDLAGAVDRFEQALQTAPDSVEAIDALRRLAEVEEQRLRVFDILEPILRHQGRWEDLLALRELRLAAIEDPEARVDELGAIADLLERALGRAPDAFEAHLRAIREEAPSPAAIEIAARLAVQLDRWGDLAEALAVKARATADVGAASALWMSSGRIAEAQLDDPARAVTAYRAALDAGGDEAEPLEALDRLYQRLEKWDDLVVVLERKLAAAGDPADQSAVEIRIARLRLERYRDVAAAVTSLRAVLERTPDSGEATLMLEGLTGHAEQVSVLLEVLTPIYRARGENRKLLELMGLRAEQIEDVGERVEMLREMARIAEDELHDPGSAFAGLARAFELAPEEPGLLDDIARLGEVLGAFEALVGLVDRTAARIEDGTARTALLLRSAGWAVRLGDPERAVAAYRAVLELEPDQDDALRSLQDLLERLGRMEELLAVIERRAGLVYDLDEKKRLYRRAAELAGGPLADKARAAAAYDHLLETDESDLEALDAVIALREELQEWPVLADLLARRLAATVETDAANAVRRRLGALLLTALDREEEGLALFREILDYQPDDEAALSTLETHYRKNERWNDLQGFFRDRLDRAADGAARIVHLLRLSDLAVEKLDAPEEALDWALQVLDYERTHAEGRARVETLMGKLGRWDDLVMHFETWAREAEGADPAAELRYLVKIGEIREREMDDPEGAGGYFEKVLAREPNHTLALAALARIHERKGDWPKCVEVLERAVQSGGDPRELSAALVRLGRVREDHLDDVPGALFNYQQAVQQNPESREAVDAVLALARKAGEWPTWAAYAEYSIRFATEDAERVKLLLDIARAQSEKIGDRTKAGQLLETARALVPDDRDVLVAVTDLAIADGRSDDAIPLLEQLVEKEKEGGRRKAREVAFYLEKLAAALEAKGDLAGAKARLEEAARQDVTNIGVAFRLGRLYYQDKDIERSMQKLRPLLLQKIEPETGIDKAEVYCLLARMHQEKGEKPKALSMVERGLQANPEHEGCKTLRGELK
jgi:tetratricopeptide (TPR) repeat protein